MAAVVVVEVGCVLPWVVVVAGVDVFDTIDEGVDWTGIDCVVVLTGVSGLVGVEGIVGISFTSDFFSMGSCFTVILAFLFTIYFERLAKSSIWGHSC